MRALTIRQPWAQAVVLGLKTCENRGSGTAYRGPLLIHAGKVWSEAGRRDSRVRHAFDTGPVDHRWCYALHHEVAWHHRPPAPFPAGAVIGAVMLVDCHLAVGCCAPWGDATYDMGSRGRVTAVHLVLDEAVVFARPVPAAGALGLWHPSKTLLAEVRSQLPVAMVAA